MSEYNKSRGDFLLEERWERDLIIRNDCRCERDRLASGNTPTEHGPTIVTRSPKCKLPHQFQDTFHFLFLEHVEQVWPSVKPKEKKSRGKKKCAQAS
jgi:hypothetical protein